MELTFNSVFVVWYGDRDDKKRVPDEDLFHAVRLQSWFKEEVIQNAYEIRQQSIARKVEQGMSKVDAEESTQSHVKLVQRMIRKFMMLMGDDEEPTPMDWMLETRTYGLHIRYSTPAEGTVSWKGETILYQEIQFTKEQVRGMVHGLVAETRQTLIKDLQGEVEVEDFIDWVNEIHRWGLAVYGPCEADVKGCIDHGPSGIRSRRRCCQIPSSRAICHTRIR